MNLQTHDLAAADRAVNERFEGKKYPEIVAAMIVAAAIDRLAENINSLYESLRSDHPLQGQTFDALEGALERIAEAIENHGGLDKIADAIEDHK